MKRVIIAGSRFFNDYKLLKQTCDKILNKGTYSIFLAGSNSTDKMAQKYADEKGYATSKPKINWGKHGRQAGPLRNISMVKNANILIAFWDGKSKNIKHMIKVARNNDLEVSVINYTEKEKAKKQGSHYPRGIKVKSERLKALLSASKTTQKQLAEAIGVHRNTIGNCIKLGRIEREEKFLKMCEYLRVAPEYLRDRKEEKSDE